MFKFNRASLRYFFIQLLPVLLLIQTAAAQSGTVDISGTVKYQYGLPVEGAEVAIYNISGRIVKTLMNSALPGGEHSVSWNGTDENGQSAGSGIYFCQLRSGNGTSESRRMVLLK
jgi:flagellar hook assembly protein FlgD